MAKKKPSKKTQSPKKSAKPAKKTTLARRKPGGGSPGEAAGSGAHAGGAGGAGGTSRADRTVEEIKKILDEGLKGTLPTEEYPTKHTVEDCHQKLRERLRMATTAMHIGNAMVAFAKCMATVIKNPIEEPLNPLEQ